MVRLLKPAPSGRVGAPPGRKPGGRWDSYFIRILAGSLAISVPIFLVGGLLVSDFAGQTTVTLVEARSQAIAVSASFRVDDWMRERQGELAQLARDSIDRVGGPTGVSTRELQARVKYFDEIEILDPAGNVVVTSAATSHFTTVQPSWFFASLTRATIQPIQRDTAGLSWIVTSPILGGVGQSQGVVVADLNIGLLFRLVAPFADLTSPGTHEVHVVNPAHYVVYSSDWGIVPNDKELIAKGSLSIKAASPIIDRALAGGLGSARITDYRHRDVLAGYDFIPSLGWAVIASTDYTTALSALQTEENWIFLIQAVGVLLLVGFAVVLARLTIRPIIALSRAAADVEAGNFAIRVNLHGGWEMHRLTTAFNGMVVRLGGVLSSLRGEVGDSAGRLSVAAEDLASATSEQTAAATATSASMEVLARSSTSIADTIDRVAIQAGETRSSLELAQADLRLSGDRTLALAGRVNEIEGILELINAIADQTSLLALNAAIEAARAGDAGRGFAVVADEVRRLADRSKGAAGQIAKLVEGAQEQSSETVMALEKGVKQMERGLAMVQAVAELSSQVQLGTNEQRQSTEDVVQAIEHIASGSRSVAETAKEIAAAAARQGALAADLAGTGWGVDDAGQKRGG